MSGIDIFCVGAWHAFIPLEVVSVWEAKAKLVESGHKEKAQYFFSFSPCKHTFHQDCPLFVSREQLDP